MPKAIIFGAGTYGELAYKTLEKDGYEIVYFCDNEEQKWGSRVFDKEVISPSRLKVLEGIEYIVIASTYYVQIADQLRKDSIRNVYIFYYRTLNKDTVKYKLLSNLGQQQFEKLERAFKNVRLDRGFKCPNGNKMSIKKKVGLRHVLIIVYAFPPIGGPSAQRPLKFVKNLRSFGWEPVVLTVGDNFYYLPEDKTLLSEIEEDIEVIRVDDSFISQEQLTEEEIQEILELMSGVVKDKQVMTDFISYIQRDKLKNRDVFLSPESCIGWATKVLKVIVDKIDFSKIDVIFSTADPYIDHIIAYYLRKNYAIPWIADFRDEWTNNYFTQVRLQNKGKEVYALERAMEYNIVHLADKVITVTPQSTQNYTNIFDLEAEKVHTITNGYDEDDFKDIKIKKSKDVFTLCYNGTMYNGVTPVPIIEVINILIKNKVIDSKKIKVIFNGRCNDTLKRKILGADSYGITQFNGYLPHAKSLEYAINAHLLLLLDRCPNPNEKNVEQAYTGKMFEYLRMRVPIVSLGTKESIIEKLLLKTQAGYNFEYTDYRGLEKYIMDYYEEWCEKGEITFNSNHHLINQYERKALTKRLVELLNEIYQD